MKGYTIIKAIGYWMGENEDSFIVQIAGLDFGDVMTIAMAYKLTFHQESVMVLRPNGVVEFV